MSKLGVVISSFTFGAVVSGLAIIVGAPELAHISFSGPTCSSPEILKTVLKLGHLDELGMEVIPESITTIGMRRDNPAATECRANLSRPINGYKAATPEGVALGMMLALASLDPTFVPHISYFFFKTDSGKLYVGLDLTPQ